jgi:hypothetical protein
MTFRFDKSSLFLVGSNIFTIILAVLQHWSLPKAMWIFWCQSIIIGFYNWKRIRSLKQFSTNGFTFNNQPVAPTKATQRKVASFFALHYGFFHFVYLIFLYAGRTNLSRFDTLGVVICIGTFAVNHRFSFQHDLESDLNRKPNIGTLMFFPYARILPMHLTILLGNHFTNQTTGTLILFLSLKTVADLIMHLIEHREVQSV